MNMVKNGDVKKPENLYKESPKSEQVTKELLSDHKLYAAHVMSGITCAECGGKVIGIQEVTKGRWRNGAADLSCATKRCKQNRRSEYKVSDNVPSQKTGLGGVYKETAEKLTVANSPIADQPEYLQVKIIQDKNWPIGIFYKESWYIISLEKAQKLADDLNIAIFEIEERRGRDDE